MVNKRPVNLNLMSFKFPLTLVSIAHRISGVLMFLLIPVALFQLRAVLSSSLNTGLMSHQGFVIQFLVWVTLVATIYHVIAGSLIMDLGFGESFSAATKSAALIFVLLVLSILFVGVWVWA